MNTRNLFLALAALGAFLVPALAQGPGQPGPGPVPTIYAPWAVTFGGLSLATAGGSASHSYAPGDCSTLAGGTFTAAAIVCITNTQVVSATVAVGGTSCTNGASQTVTGTSGTGTKFQALVTVAGNTITQVNSISVPGNYTVNPASLTNAPVTGVSCSGSQLSVVMGALIGVVKNGGTYQSVPSVAATLSESSSTGTGTGATWNVSFGPIGTPSYPFAGATVNLDPGYAIGYLALANNTNGYANYALGAFTLQSNTNGPESLAIGWGTLQNFTGFCAAGNTGVGTHILGANQTGCQNVGLGSDALGNLISSSDNIGIGVEALGANNLGSQNIGIGTDAGEFGTTARANNVFVGYMVARGQSTSSESQMTLLGSQTFNSTNLTAAIRGVGVGDGIGYTTAVAPVDIAIIGSGAASIITSPTNLSVFGSGAASKCTSCAHDIVIGDFVASTTLQTGTHNLLISTQGSATDTAAGNTSNTLNIENIITATGTGTPATSIPTIHGLPTLPDVGTDAATTDASLCRKSSDGTILIGSGTLGICLGTSSARYKTGIAPLNAGLHEVMALQPKSFYLDAQHGDPKKLMYGFTAEDTEEVLPKLVGMDADGKPNTADYLGMVPVLVNAIKEQQKQIERLSAGTPANDNCHLRVTGSCWF